MSASRKDLDPVFDAKRIQQIDEYERDAREGNIQSQKVKNNLSGPTFFSEKERARIEAYYNDLPAASAESAPALQGKK